MYKAKKRADLPAPGTVRSGEVVELLPFGEPSSKVTVIGVGEELIELLLIGSMRALDLAVKLRRSGFDIGMANAEVFDMPMELGLEFMAIVRSHFADAERELIDDGIDEVDRV